MSRRRDAFGTGETTEAKADAEREATNEDWRATTFARDATIATLTERIRELETELDIATDNLNLAIAERFEFAKRAEKAEARVAELVDQLEAAQSRLDDMGLGDVRIREEREAD